MKVLLTGDPGCGKTTLLEKCIETVSDKQGFIAREVREDGQRVGFELISSSGQVATLAHINSDSKIRVSRYGVELSQLDDFLLGLPLVAAGTLLYVDEIGQMQLFSDMFKKLIITYLDSANPYIGTISSVFRNDFIEDILRRDDIVLLTITQDNREQVQKALEGLMSNSKAIQEFDSKTQRELTKMARSYASSARFTQLKKLLKNAVRYLAEHRVYQVDDDRYHITGDTNEHTVLRSSEQWICDCDLFKGTGNFEGNAGECSHIQASKLLLTRASG